MIPEIDRAGNRASPKELFGYPSKMPIYYDPKMKVYRLEIGDYIVTCAQIPPREEIEGLVKILMKKHD